MNVRYSRSNKFLDQAEKVIPLGSQTFSKSRTQYPPGVSPLFIDRGRGAYVWDIDENRYIDFVSNLASVTLGYADRKQNLSVIKQLKKGVGFSLPSTLETIVAEKVTSLIPSVEMVRFGKNGSDATSAAVRLARAYTGRNHILVCGYHGWQDWYIGSTSRNKGVPTAVQSLTHPFPFNNLDYLKNLFLKLKGDVAAVILEPMNSEWPKDNFLKKVIDLCDKEESICIFDETITGFRFSNGGAQNIFGVKPHLSTFGKGVANGFPLSIVGGRKEIMSKMEEIFFSGTFGGELLSLAAANYVLDMHINNEVSPRLIEIGHEWDVLVNEAISENRMGDFVYTSGHESWKFLLWKHNEYFDQAVLRQLFMQEIFKRGVICLSSHNVTLAHKSSLLKKAAEVYHEVFGFIRKKIEDRSVSQALETPLLAPLFKVR